MTRFKQYTTLDPQFVAEKLQEFFKEDNIQKDITTTSTQKKSKDIQAVLIAKEPLVFAGMEIIQQGFSDCVIDDLAEDGTFLNSDDTIATIQGNVSSILKKERVILNLIQRLSGIATTAHKLSQITDQYNIELLDTRKTTPGLRVFEKFAVTVGGGVNHRFSLQDSIMIKDNHLMGNPDILEAISKAKQENPHKDIQVEVDTLEQLDIVLQSKATSVLLDNFKPSTLTQAINKIRTHPHGSNLYIELSGGITAKTLSGFCLDGVNGISIGALTHNIQSKDISLDIK